MLLTAISNEIEPWMKTKDTLPELPVRIGLIGVGKWGQNYKRIFKELDIPVVTCDLNGGEDTKNYWDILKDCGIKAIVIATPPETHADIVLHALTMKKDVLVEKPLAIDISQAQELKSKIGNQVLMVGHLLHYHSEAEALKDKAARAGIKKVLLRGVKNEPARKDDVVWALAPHLMSFALSFAEPSQIESFFSFKGTKRENSIEIVGEDNFTIDWTQAEGGDLLKEEVKHFLHCVRTREKPLTDVEDGIKTLQCLISYKENLKS